MRTAIPFLVALIAAAVAFAFSCATADFKDAADGGKTKICSQDPIVFCEAGVPSKSCDVGTAESDPRLSRLAPGSYADHCVVNFLGTGHDDNGDCILAAVCKCEDTAFDAAAPPTWVCGP
jgi:hypothetical protein